MDPKTLCNLLLNIVDAQPLTDADKYELIGRFASGVFKDLPPYEEPVKVTSKPEKKEAPKPVEPVHQGNIIIPKGKLCTCEICNAHAYEIVADVYQTMRLDAFRACFSPALNEDGGVWSDPEGNAAADCPVCKGEKTVWILGKGPLLYKDFDAGSSDRPAIDGFKEGKPRTEGV